MLTFGMLAAMMRLVRWVLVCVVLAVPGCARQGKPPVSDDSSELTRRPQVLLEAGVDVASVQLHGIRLGDEERQARQLKVDEQTPAGWLVLWDNNRLRVSEGRVVGLGLWNGEQVQRLAIENESDIERLLGKPAAIETVRVSMNDIRMHQYPQRGLSVLWNATDDRLIAINITPPQP
jgi:hypothetical protein